MQCMVLFIHPRSLAFETTIALNLTEEFANSWPKSKKANLLKIVSVMVLLVYNLTPVRT